MKPLTLNSIDSYYGDLPLRLKDGRALVQFGSGRRFAAGCVHDSFAEAESHGHSFDEWCKQTTKCLILYGETNE